jgi:hypothetical protein
MKRLGLTILLVLLCCMGASAQKKKYYKPDKTKMTPEQRMIESNSRKKNQGRDADVAKKVQRAKKQDRTSRHLKKKKKRG